jgi:hypothetical protein
MRKDLPPVKNPSGKEVRATVKDYEGHFVYPLVSNEVSGMLHFKSPVKEFWITVEEYDDIRHKLVGGVK